MKNSNQHIMIVIFTIFFVSNPHNWKANPNHHSYDQDRKNFSKFLTFLDETKIK